MRKNQTTTTNHSPQDQRNHHHHLNYRTTQLIPLLPNPWIVLLFPVRNSEDTRLQTCPHQEGNWHLPRIWVRDRVRFSYFSSENLRISIRVIFLWYCMNGWYKNTTYSPILTSCAKLSSVRYKSCLSGMTDWSWANAVTVADTHRLIRSSVIRFSALILRRRLNFIGRAEDVSGVMGIPLGGGALPS